MPTTLRRVVIASRSRWWRPIPKGGKTEITVTLQEKDLNDTAPVVEIAPEDKVLHVAEEALAGGIKDDLSSTTTATGKITFTDADKTPDINTFSVEMEGLQTVASLRAALM
jgi:hypothetical protein